MPVLDCNGLPHDLVADEEIVVLSRDNTGFVLMTNGDTSDERARMLEFVLGGKKVYLEHISVHPELQAIFQETIDSCRRLLTQSKSFMMKNTEDVLRNRAAKKKKRTE